MDYKEYIVPFVTYDLPVPYKGLSLYPVKVKDFLQFATGIDVFKIDKNKNTTDINIIQMSYLEFLFALISNEEKWLLKFINIMELCCGTTLETNMIIDKKYDTDIMLYFPVNKEMTHIFINGRNIYFELTEKHVSIIINGVKINGTQFDNFMALIMYQNFRDYDDSFVSEDVQRVVNDYYSIKQKNIVQPSFEEKISIVMANSGLGYDEIMNLSYRKFDIIFHSIVDKLDYLIGQIARTQGADIQVNHWVYRENKGKFADVFKSVNTVTDKIK